MTKLTSIFEKANVKRRLASRVGCICDLKEELPIFFEAYRKACDAYNNEIVQTPPESRCRCFEATLLNSKLIHAFQTYFPTDWKYGKYRRFILRKNGYLVLLKKLDGKGMPMNIKTRIVESIHLQSTKSLFEESSYSEDPILFFGYKKDRIGNIHNPQIVYIDENKINWTIDEYDISERSSEQESSIEPVSPTIRASKKAINE